MPQAIAPIESAAIPDRLYIPMPWDAQRLVRVGAQVAAHEPLAIESNSGRSIVASASGTVAAILDHPVVHPGGLRVPTVVVETDGAGRSHALGRLSLDSTPTETLLRRVGDAGIVGLGGAGYPAIRKLIGVRAQAPVALIINAMDSDPGVQVDRALVWERSRELTATVRTLARCIGADALVLAIPSTMPEGPWTARWHESGITVKRIEHDYLAGDERRLRRTLAVDIGARVPLIHNADTLFSIYRAWSHGERQTTRVVTVSGDGNELPRNVEAMLGTRLRDLLDAGHERSNQHGPDGATGRPSVLVGGWMMGIEVHELDAPIDHRANAIVGVPSAVPRASASPCIRCGWCAEHCPVGLEPQTFHEWVQADTVAQLSADSLSRCTECGLCAYVCPSAIPLVHEIRFAKGERLRMDRAAEAAKRAEAGVGRREVRLERQRAERERQLDQRRGRRAISDRVKAAIARGDAKRQAREESDVT
ncbi:MAG: 4Fe-4S dicluster domain-containing protein [Pseudomonadota bacterium]